MRLRPPQTSATVSRFYAARRFVRSFAPRDFLILIIARNTQRPATEERWKRAREKRDNRRNERCVCYGLPHLPQQRTAQPTAKKAKRRKHLVRSAAARRSTPHMHTDGLLHACAKYRIQAHPMDAYLFVALQPPITPFIPTRSTGKGHCANVHTIQPRVPCLNAARLPLRDETPPSSQLRGAAGKGERNEGAGSARRPRSSRRHPKNAPKRWAGDEKKKNKKKKGRQRRVGPPCCTALAPLTKTAQGASRGKKETKKAIAANRGSTFGVSRRRATDIGGSKRAVGAGSPVGETLGQHARSDHLGPSALGVDATTPAARHSRRPIVAPTFARVSRLRPPPRPR